MQNVIEHGESISALDVRASVLHVHEIPHGVPKSQDFVVAVRIPGQAWQQVECYRVEVDLHHRRFASMAYFDFRGTVEVAVTVESGDFASVRLRPDALGIKHEVNGRTITFTLDQPCNLSLEIDEDRFHNLHLFAGDVFDDAALRGCSNTIYFGPGVHEPGESLAVPSNTTVCLAAGSVLRTKLVCDRVENVRICGRGVLLNPERGVEVTFAKNVQIEGIAVLNPRHYTVFGGQSQGIQIRGLRAFSSEIWSDGIDLMSCRDVLIDGVFLRTSDDCVAIYGHRWDYYGDVRNITVQNSTLWADVAHPIVIGTHGNPENPEVIEGIKILNCDVLNHHEPQLGYQGCIAVNASDANLVRDVWVEDVRIADFEEGQILNLRVNFNQDYATAPGRGIHDVYIKNLSYVGRNAQASLVWGYDANRKIRNVTFENLLVNGVLISDDMKGKPKHYRAADLAGIFVGEHVEGVRFLCGS